MCASSFKIYSVGIKISAHVLIEVNASYVCTDSFFPSSKKPGLELEQELSHLTAETMVGVLLKPLTTYPPTHQLLLT